jgi:hemolysin activation/secretion protein
LKFNPLIAIAITSPALAVSSVALAQIPIPSTPPPIIEELRQQERERALRQQNERAVDERLLNAATAAPTRIPEAETPCFRIDRIQLAGEHADAFQWALSALPGPAGDDTPLGRCLGTTGVNAVLSRVQAAVVERGWVTSRVLAAPQDLSTGTLTLTLVPGRIAAIRLAADSDVPLLGGNVLLATAIPAQAGDLLNLRDIEQGLENLKRVPTVEADIQIEPSKAPNARPGDSDLVVGYSRKRIWRAALSLDDSGTDETGRLQGGLTLSLDNPLGLNDLFYVNASHSLTDHDGRHGTEGQTIHYDIPYGDWQLGFTASQNRYHQTVEGLNQDYIYAGKSNNEEIKLSRLVYRDQHRKTTLALKAWRRESRNAIDDTEIDNQHRVTGGWEAGINHREFIGEATLEGNLAYRRGTGVFGAIPAPEAQFGEGTSRMALYTADLGLNLPFKLGDQKLRYNALWRAQWNRTPLTPQDRFAIGGRYTVRGFDGETSLLGDRGWLVRNDTGWALPGLFSAAGAEVYLGVDYGQVGGPGTLGLLGDHLAGGVIGVRGAWQKLYYDFFGGKPISKPVGYRTASTTFGFNLSASF